VITQSTLWISVLLIASVMNAFFAVYAWHHRRSKIGAIPYIGIVLSLTFYSLGYAFEINSSTLEGVIFWLRVEYLGVSFFPALWLVLVFEYIGADKLLNRTLVAALFIIPVITLILHYTNSAHHLFYKEILLETKGEFSIAVLTKGLWYWIHLAYTYFSLIYGNLLLMQTYRRVAASYKLQVVCMMAGSLLPLAGNFIYLAGYSPWGIDLSPFMIAFSSPLYAWGLFQFRLFDLVPIARDKVFEGIREGVIVLDEKNRLADFNPAAQLVFPQLTASVIGQPIDELVTHEEFIRHILFDTLEFEIETTAENDPRHFHSRVSTVATRRGIVIGKTIVLHDITERIRLLEKLRSLAMIDETTQIYNRRKFTQASRQEILQAKASKKSIAILFFDIDFFKRINDNYGHAVGDLMLYTIAQKCRENLRPTDIFARYGGEEFAICLVNSTDEEAYDIAERLRLVIADISVRVEDRQLSVTASFGVTATADAENADLDQLLKEADTALYAAKQAGRDCVVLYQQQQHVNVI